MRRQDMIKISGEFEFTIDLSLVISIISLIIALL
jgi:hypothetical protein